MANILISALTAVTTVVPSTDVIPVINGGTTKKATVDQLVSKSLSAGGSATSHHLAGRAADIHLIPDTKDAIFDAAVKIEKIVPYQEFFMEYAKGGASHWIHISYDRNNKTKELQTWVQHSKRSNGLVKLYSGNVK